MRDELVFGGVFFLKLNFERSILFGFTDCSKVCLNWCRNPFVSIPPMKRNLVACFTFDDFVILHLNGLTWSLPLLTENLGGDPPPQVWWSCQSSSGGSGKWAAPPWPPRRELCFCSSGIDSRGAEWCDQGMFCVREWADLLELFWYSFYKLSTKIFVWT